ncbi:hypothetical protein [Rhizobium sp. NXC24]|uniref:hypothetical protein n=1 Tax=Rhizobium sp. NXC24 TaxID=2048897 RepID=UPI000CDF323F|nr:hypothetical protein [Rhizobium sp. NXC24]AVA23670.1 hypothetical protein NXC24_PA00022 [Rhizobium sp. NXC24]
MSRSDNPGNNDAADIRKDARGQYRRLVKKSCNNGVASVKPKVITGSDDATLNKMPPGEKKPEKDWDLNYDPADMNEGKYRG